ncbi:cistern family PEP-CTERM protein [Rubrivivax sp. A210]|uniref:cistern family PEP-CTERM protein n=1 Tax=Rubrivivax sp. A210 TaxID=2772301 RepID=UPI001918FA10|nr:cistern family PEP-CTERM protein [Rubrivivax sp. A210]
MQFDAVGDSFAVSFAPDANASRSLSATLVYTLEGFSNGDADFRIDVQNTSSGAGNNALASFGVVAITPQPLLVNDADLAWDTFTNRTLSGQQVDFCARVDMGISEFATGAPRIQCNNTSFRYGVSAGETSSLNVTMSFGGAFDLAHNDISFDGFVVRFIDVGAAFGVRALAGVYNAVPEPVSLALALLGLMAIPAFRRRRA